MINYIRVTIALLMFSISPLQASELEMLQGKSFSASKDTRLVVTAKQGNIYFKVWSKNEVYVQFNSETESAMKDWDMSSSGNKIAIVQKSMRNSFGGEIMISIPSSLILKVTTNSGNIIFQGNFSGETNAFTSAGDIDFDDLKGTIKLVTSGGDISTGALSGTISLNTSGGDIVTGKADGKGEIKTSGGDIDIKSVSGTFSVATAGGDIYIDELSGEVTVNTAGGDINLSTCKGNAKVTTSGGSINAKILEGDLKASTTAGDIDVHKISGSLDAQTLAGQINAGFFAPKGQSRLTSAYGDINVSVAPTAKLHIDAVVTYIEKWDEYLDADEVISSDFKSNTPAPSDNKNLLRRSYTINNGGNTLHISVKMGNISIKKATK